MKRHLLLLSLLGTLLGAAPSFYTSRPPDPEAVLLSAPEFKAHADGVGDDAEALQRAIDTVQARTRQGVVLIPEGRYRLGRTVHVWSGIRLIGFGPTRPTLVLGPHTPGFQDGQGKYLLYFASHKPEGPEEPVEDANPGTFYSALSNVDLQIEEGNPAAIGLRFHVAQHGFVSHVEFRTGSGRAGIEEIGNEVEDCRFLGGEYGIYTHKPSPSWPFLLIDSVFEGQRTAGIETEEAGLTVIRGAFRNLPSAIVVREQRVEELVMQDTRLEAIRGPALVFSEEHSPRLQVNLRGLSCKEVPDLVQFRESGRLLKGPSSCYQVRRLTHGLQLSDNEEPGEVRTTHELVSTESLPEAIPSDLPPPAPVAEWVSAHDFGARGDGLSDDTEALRQALSQARTVFLPAGRYLVSDTLRLRAEGQLVGLSPIRSQIVLRDDAPAFRETPAKEVEESTNRPQADPRPSKPAVGTPKALLETETGGETLLSGIGLDTGQNPRAVALLWRAGAHSLVNDVRFLGGHGGYHADGSPVEAYNDNRTGDPDPRRRWDSQYPSLWVTDEGGGSFKDLWTPNTFAAAGLLVSDTRTSGRLYALSSEHHLRNEVIFRNASNWDVYALQMEEERAEGEHTLPLSIEGCSRLRFWNLYLYRVMRSFSPAPCAIRVTKSSELEFHNVHLYGPSKFNFDTTLAYPSCNIEVRAREIASLHISGKAKVPWKPVLPPTVAPGAQLERLAEGFNNLDHTVVDRIGRLYAVDARWQRIHRWNHATRELDTVLDAPIEPVSLGIDSLDTLLILTRTGQVFALPAEGRAQDLRRLQTREAVDSPRGPTLLPVTRWNDEHRFLELHTRKPARLVLAPDGKTRLPVDCPFTDADENASYYSTIDLVRAYALGTATPGGSFCVADEFAQKTYRYHVNEEGLLTDPVLLAQEGEAGVVQDEQGNTYLCAGQVWVYSPDGLRLGCIALPERPSSLVFGGPDGKTLFIAARHGLYALKMTTRGSLSHPGFPGAQGPSHALFPRHRNPGLPFHDTRPPDVRHAGHNEPGAAGLIRK